MFVICSAIVFFGKVNDNYEISKICSMVEISKICMVVAFLSEADPQGSYALMAFSELPANRSEAACSNHEAHRRNSGDQSAVWRLLLWFA